MCQDILSIHDCGVTRSASARCQEGDRFETPPDSTLQQKTLKIRLLLQVRESIGNVLAKKEVQLTTMHNAHLGISDKDPLIKGLVV